MKHSWKITAVLLVVFLLAQFVGIGIMYKYVDVEKSAETGKTEFLELPIGERPPMDEGTSFLWVVLVIVIGTGFLLLIIKYNVYWLWKIWFLLAIVLALTVAFGAIVRPDIAAVLAIGLGVWKIFKPNVWVQNFTELFIYGGLAAIFVPLFNLWSVIILLILISVYDAYAVWQSKHMITLAKSQAKAKIFAGLLIPYQLKAGKKMNVAKNVKKLKTKAKKVPMKIRTAMLGGGDIGFPLIFAGVILKVFGLWEALLIPLFSGTALLALLLKGNEKKFYPAMPFISAGCFVGLAVVWLIQWLL